MKNVKSILALTLCLIGFGNLVFAQCGFTPGTYCVPFATTTSGATITIPVTCTSGTIYDFPTPSGELSFVSSTGTGTATGSITVRCAPNSRCPGVVRVRFGNASCLSGAEMRIDKSFTQANLNSFYSAIFGLDDNSQPKPYAINATGCLDPGGQVTLSVVPLNCSVTDPITWSFVDASNNPISGWTERYRSTDGSSITVDVPSAATFTQPCTVKVRVGVCAATNVVHAQRIIFPSASAPDISLVSGTTGTPQVNNPNTNSIPSGGVFGDRTLCVNADYGYTFPDNSSPYTSNTITLQATPNESAAGVTYTWTVPQGFDLVSQSGNQAVIRIYGGTAGASGVITVRAARANSCSGDVARVTISRKLVAYSGGNVSNAQFAFNLPNPNWTSLGTPAPTNCSTGSAPWPLEVKQDYLLVMQNVPLNTPITWSSSTGGNPYWEFRPNPSVKVNTVYATSIVTQAPNVIGRCRIPVGFTSTGTTPMPTISISGGTCNTTLQYSPAIKLPGSIRLAINISGSNGNQNNNLTVVNAAGAPAWPQTAPCGQNNIRYIWSFQGTFTPAGGSANAYNNTEYEGTDIFNVNNVLGQNVTNLAPGIYNGTFRVAVHNGASSCTNCFGAEASLPFSATVNRPSGGGGGGENPTLILPPSLRLSPNPAGKEVWIETQYVEEGGTIEIRNSQGALVKQVSNAAPKSRIVTESFTKGIYTVEYRDKKGRMASEKLIIE